jgi:hypothetical protein
MIYQGYTTDEIKQLVPLLEELKIAHTLGADAEGMAAIDEAVKRKRPVAWEMQSTTVPSHYQLEIADEVLAQLTVEQFARLEKFRIFPPTFEVPDFNVPPANLKESKWQMWSAYFVGSFLVFIIIFFAYVFYLFLQERVFR